MDTIQEKLEKQVEKINLIENFIALSLRRENISSVVNSVSSQVDEVKKQMVAAQSLITDELEDLKGRHKAVMRRMLQQQKLILEHVCNERQRKIMEAEQEEVQMEHVLGSNKKFDLLALPAAAHKGSAKENKPTSICKNLMHSFKEMHLNPNSITPKMSINDYKESPMVKRSIRINPIPFTFLEFDTEITEQQFKSIPKYMRGRENIDDLSTFLLNVITPCFNDKYKLLHRQRSTVRNPSDLTLWKLYNEQADYLPGRYFITSGDISRKLGKLFDKKIQSRLVMLRHIGVLQEQRISQTVCYIWSTN